MNLGLKYVKITSMPLGFGRETRQLMRVFLRKGKGLKRWGSFFSGGR